MTTWRDTPIYVTNRDNLERGFRRLLTWLEAAGHTNVTVIDNASTWPPLLEFYEKSPQLMVLRLPENKGPYAFWHLGLQAQHDVPFVVTDPDVVPAATCPRDLVRQMLEVAGRERSKVGPSLRIDNLPSCYRLRDAVVAWEKQFWQHKTPEGDAYEAQLDTTFALYQPGMGSWPEDARYLRLAPPYTMEHVPWYEDSAHPSEEAIYYREHADVSKWTHWTKLEAVIK